jgi:hypothetical protein
MQIIELSGSLQSSDKQPKGTTVDAYIMGTKEATGHPVIKAT